MGDINLNEDIAQAERLDRTFLFTIAIVVVIEVGLLLWMLY